MFMNCTLLINLDIRNFEFGHKYSNLFSNVPATSQIIVKDETQRTWLTTRFSELTNVVLPSEL